MSLTAHGLAWGPSGLEPLFHGLDLALAPGWHGLVGPNGAGKTTLLELLAGRRVPTAGHVTRAGAVGYLEQVPPEETGVESGTVAGALGLGAVVAALARLEAGDAADDVFAAIGDAWDAPERARAVLARLGLGALALERAMASLSGGERTRVRLAALLLDAPPALLLDEPTNHLDRGARAALAEALRGYRGVLLVASHDRELLERADSILELRAGRLARVGGGYSAYVEWREGEDQAAARDLQACEQDLARERREAAVQADRVRHKQAHGKKRAATAGLPAIVRGAMQRAAEESAGKSRDLHAARVDGARAEVARARDRLPPKRQIVVDLPGTELGVDRRVVEARGLNFGYAGRQLWRVSRDFAIDGPARVAVTGANGSGKSTLLRLIAGLPAPEGLVVSGRLTLGREPSAFLDQSASQLDRSLSVLANMQEHAPHLPEPERRVRLGRFLFEQERALAPVSGLSGGERMRAALACLLARRVPPRVLVLDEPTNHLDLDSIAALASALNAFRGALVVASHDAKFLEDLGITRQIEL